MYAHLIWEFLTDGWSLFDFFIVTISLVSAFSSSLKGVSIFRYEPEARGPECRYTCGAISHDTDCSQVNAGISGSPDFWAAQEHPLHHKCFDW